MLTAAAARADAFATWLSGEVHTRAELVAMGYSRHAIDAQLAARRWQRVARVVVLHNGELSRDERWRAAVLNCGPRAVLASFSAAELLGLRGWERDELHVLAPAGVARPVVPGLPIVLHRTSRPVPPGFTQPASEALVLAASSMRRARPACGILAAGVQQRLTTAAALGAALGAAPRIRHRRLLTAATADIAMGAQALSEIDFVRLCRRHGLPAPRQQAIRVERNGRRRYLDAEWVRRDGRRVVVEVDGALHLTPRRWFDDQLRQNEVVLDGSLMLRYPSVVVRAEKTLVVDRLRRALLLKPNDLDRGRRR